MTSLRRAVALAVPIALPVGMTGLFAIARARLGPERAYRAGFVAYWIACLGLTVGLIGPRRAGRLIRGGDRAIGPPTAVGAAFLLWPPVGAVATRAIPQARTATRADILTIAGIAAANSLSEELLWRGVYTTLWPDDARLGWAWPSIGFGLWHLAPQVIHRSEMGATGYVAAATALGLSWGWVARRSESLRWVLLSHLVTDASGLRNARYFRS